MSLQTSISSGASKFFNWLKKCCGYWCFPSDDSQDDEKSHASAISPHNIEEKIMPFYSAENDLNNEAYASFKHRICGHGDSIDNSSDYITISKKLNLPPRKESMALIPLPQQFASSSLVDAIFRFFKGATTSMDAGNQPKNPVYLVPPEDEYYNNAHSDITNSY